LSGPTLQVIPFDRLAEANHRMIRGLTKEHHVREVLFCLRQLFVDWARCFPEDAT
jgi:hypothetical protein